MAPDDHLSHSEDGQTGPPWRQKNGLAAQLPSIVERVCQSSSLDDQGLSSPRPGRVMRASVTFIAQEGKPGRQWQRPESRALICRQAPARAMCSPALQRPDRLVGGQQRVSPSRLPARRKLASVEPVAVCATRVVRWAMHPSLASGQVPRCTFPIEQTMPRTATGQPVWGEAERSAVLHPEGDVQACSTDFACGPESRPARNGEETVYCPGSCWHWTAA